MTETRKVRVWDRRPRHAETHEITLPKYWHQQDLFDASGETRDTFVRLLPDGVRTQIVASQMPRSDPVWSIETTWSSSWLDTYAVYEIEFFGKPDSGWTKEITAERFEELEALVQVIISGEPQPSIPGPT
ncbi:hypothetical protein [Bradyrhizobium sp.]